MVTQLLAFAFSSSRLSATLFAVLFCCWHDRSTALRSPPPASQTGCPVPPVLAVTASVSWEEGSFYPILAYPRDYKRLCSRLGSMGGQDPGCKWSLSRDGNPRMPLLLSFGAPICFPRGFSRYELLFSRISLSGLGRWPTSSDAFGPSISSLLLGLAASGSKSWPSPSSGNGKHPVSPRLLHSLGVLELFCIF